MATKGIEQSLIARQKIKLSKTKDRTQLVINLQNYILGLQPKDFPSITRAAIYAGISEKALLALELRSEEDSDVRILLEFIRDLQKASLVEGGLNKTLDSKMSTFLLQATHGMKNEAPNLTQNNFFSGISPEILAEALELSRSKTPHTKNLKE